MRIAVWHNLPSGGGKRALHDHVKGLVRLGHHVEAWCPPSAETGYLPLDRVIEEHVVPLEMEDGGTGILGALAGPRIMRKNLAAMDAHCARCAMEINEGDFDILFANSCSSFATSPIARHVAMPALLYLHEPFRILYEALPKLPWLADLAASELDGNVSRLRHAVGRLLRLQSLRLQGQAEVSNASAFHTILVNSRFSRESVLKVYGLEAKVCYLGIDLEQFRPTGEVKEGFVVGLGAFSYHKGPDRAIKALGTIPKSSRPRLVWISNSSPNPNFEEEMRTLARGCEVELEIRTRIDDAELPSILSRAAALLYTSRLEPFGFAPLEANACGTGVVAIAEGGVRETVVEERNGLLVDSFDPDAIGKAVQRLLEDDAFAAELGRRGSAYVSEHWRLSEAVDRLALALEKAMAEGE